MEAWQSIIKNKSVLILIIKGRRKDPRTEGINYLHFMKNLVQEKGVMKNPEVNQSKLS